MEEEIEAKEKKKEVHVLISVKPKYTEEFCIMMVACKELCKRACKSKNLAKIDEVFSVIGPFDFLLELSGVGENEEEMDKKINKTIFKIRETLGRYINETCTLTKFDLSEYLKPNKYLFSWDKVPGKREKQLLNSLKDEFGIDWAENAESPTKSDDCKTIFITRDRNSANITIDKEKKRAPLEINGHITHYLKVEDELEIYKQNSKVLFEKAESLETETERKDDELNDFKGFLEKGTFDRLDILQQELDCDTALNRWEKNECLFSLRHECTSHLKEGIVDGTLKKEFESKKQSLSDKAKVSKIDEKNWRIVDGTKRYGIYDTDVQSIGLNIYKIITKDVHVLIKIKPEYTEQFCVAMAVCKSLCNRASASKNLAKIDEVFSVFGLFDFLLELSGEGKNKEEMDEKINKTILKIRETLGSYINETLTITKFKIPMTKEELEKFFDKKLGVKYLVKLPGRDGETIPDESKPEIDLKELYDAETTPLKNLLRKAKTFWEPEDLNKRIVDLTNRVEELEKRS